MNQFSLVTRIVASSVCVSQRAGKIVRDIMSKGELGIVEKGKNDLQTEADRMAQKCIIASLNQQFPRVSIIGEEESTINDCQDLDSNMIETEMNSKVLEKASVLSEELQHVKDEDIVIWIDPLDGTSEYTQGLLDHVTVLIGVSVLGRAVAGVIYQPYYNYTVGTNLGRAIWGIVGLGAFGFQKTSPPDGGRIITTTRSHSNATVVEAVDSCEPTEVIRVGGAGHKVLLLLEGRAHAYVFGSPGCKKWDTCAPEAVLHSIGGKLTDIHGNRLCYHASVQKRNSGGVLATWTGAEHPWYLHRIPQSVKDNLPVNK